MGLFGSIFKGIGKLGGGVLKAVASKATGGLSDSLLKALKQKGAAKAALKQQQYTMAQLTQAEKLRPLSPSTRSTEGVLDDAVSGTPGTWNPGGGGTSRKRMPGRRKVSQTTYGRLATVSDRDLIDSIAYSNGKPLPSEAKLVAEALRRGLHVPGVSGRLKAASRRPAKAHRAKRRPPPGGLDLKALSASWRAAGRPGTWQGWIAANK